MNQLIELNKLFLLVIWTFIKSSFTNIHYKLSKKILFVLEI